MKYTMDELEKLEKNKEMILSRLKKNKKQLADLIITRSTQKLRPTKSVKLRLLMTTSLVMV